MSKMMKAALAAALATVSVSASAWWGNPYAVPAPYGVSAEQQQALNEQYQAMAAQQQAFAQQQAQYFQHAVEAQLKMAEQVAADPNLAHTPIAQELRIREMERQMMERAATDQRRFFDQVRDGLAARPVAFTAPAQASSFEDRVKELDAQRSKSKAELAAQREEATKKMDERREEAKKRFEAQREASKQRHSAAL